MSESTNVTGKIASVAAAHFNASGSDSTLAATWADVYLKCIQAMALNRIANSLERIAGTEDFDGEVAKLGYVLNAIAVRGGI